MKRINYLVVTGSSTSIKTSKPSHIEIIHSTVKGQGWKLAKYETSLGVGLVKAKNRKIWHIEKVCATSKTAQNYSKATIFKTFCHSLMTLRAVINSHGLIRRKNCSHKRKLPQKLVPWSKLYIVHSHLKFWRKMLTTIQKATLCTPNYNTLNDNAILVILFSDVVFTVFDSDERIKIECDFYE